MADPILTELRNLQAPEDALGDLLQLGRAFRDINNARSRIREIEATATAERERIDRWEHDETESDRKLIARCEQSIGVFALARRADGEKSLSTPWGIVETREMPPEFNRDEDVLFPFAEKHGYIREKVVRTIDWERLKKACRQMSGRLLLDGEPVPGVLVRDREPSVTVTPWE